MTKHLPYIFTGVITALLLVIITLLASRQLPVAEGGAPPGYQTELATTSSRRVTTTESFLLSTSTCTARVITTGKDNIVIGFGSHASGTLRHEEKGGADGTFQIGHLQVASTTVTYDSETYGCGYWTYRGPTSGASSVINVSEFNGFR